MFEHRGVIGGSFLVSAVAAWIAAASIVATNPRQHFGSSIVLALLAAGGLLFFLAILAFLWPAPSSASPLRNQATIRPDRSPRPTAEQRAAHDLLTEEFERPTLPELKMALRHARREGRELLARVRLSEKNPWVGDTDTQLSTAFTKWAGGWPIYLNEYAPPLYNVYRKQGMGQSRYPIRTLYDVKEETKKSLRMLAKVRRRLWWESVRVRLGL